MTLELANRVAEQIADRVDLPLTDGVDGAAKGWHVIAGQLICWALDPADRGQGVEPVAVTRDLPVTFDSRLG